MNDLLEECIKEAGFEVRFINDRVLLLSKTYDSRKCSATVDLRDCDNPLKEIVKAMDDMLRFISKGEYNG